VPRMAPAGKGVSVAVHTPAASVSISPSSKSLVAELMYAPTAAQKPTAGHDNDWNEIPGLLVELRGTGNPELAHVPSESVSTMPTSSASVT
jgi:hypothetical protein